MQKLEVFGANKLKGQIKISGSKNASLPILAATLLSKKKIYLKNLPRVKDIETMVSLLQSLGSKINFNKNNLVIDNVKQNKSFASYSLVKTMRAGILVLGPLLAKFGKAKVSLPGGCAIGTRPVDIHLSALSKLGVKYKINQGYVHATAPNGLIGSKIKFSKISVGATENLIIAASFAKGTTILNNCAIEPEIKDLVNFLIKMGCNIKWTSKRTIKIEGIKIANETEYIIVRDSKGQAPKYFETFEDVGNPDFQITPIFKTGIQWEENTSVGYKSKKSYQAKVLSSTPIGSVYSIQLPPVNLKELQGQQPRLSFFVSYAPHTSANNTETLRVLISSDCGHTFQPFIQRVGAGLAYPRASQVDNFIPTSDDQWKLINFSLTNYDTVESAIFRFDVETRGGNSVYLDDINIGRFVSSVIDVQSLGMSIFPNPSESDVTIRLEKEQWIHSVVIRDCVGKVVDIQEMNIFSSSTRFKNKKNLKGLYLISVNTSLGKSTSSIIFE